MSFPRSPDTRVAITDDDAGLDAAVNALAEAGMDVAAVDVLSGPEGARLLDATGTSHRLRAERPCPAYFAAERWRP